MTRAGEACVRCGRSPAEGFATINGERYCHGDEQRPSCYERTLWERKPDGDTTH